MKYDEAKIETGCTKNWSNSGNESLGFESFNRDSLCFCTNTVDTNWAPHQALWSPQGTSSESYSDSATLSWCDAKADSIATLEGSVRTLGNSASSISSDIDTLNQKLKILAAKMGVNFDTEAKCKLDLKNHRGRRLKRSDLQTI